LTRFFAVSCQTPWHFQVYQTVGHPEYHVRISHPSTYIFLVALDFIPRKISGHAAGRKMLKLCCILTDMYIFTWCNWYTKCWSVMGAFHSFLKLWKSVARANFSLLVSVITAIESCVTDKQHQWFQFIVVLLVDTVIIICHCTYTHSPFNGHLLGLPGYQVSFIRSSRKPMKSTGVWNYYFYHLPLQGGHKVGDKNSLSFPGFSRATNLLFHRLSQQKVNVIMTFIKGHDDPVYPINSCFTQIFLWRTKNTLFVTIFSEVAQTSQNSRSFHVQRNPWVFQVCGHPALLLPSQQFQISEGMTLLLVNKY